MIASSDPLPLAAEFPPATREQWRKLVDGVLKGAPFERLLSRTADALTIEPLYPRAADTQPEAGRAAGTRWKVIARIDHPDPAASNAEALHELDNGANGLSLVPAGAIGARSYGLAGSAETILGALAGVHLAAGTLITLEYSPHVPDLPLALAGLVGRQGASPDTVDIQFGLDPIGALARHGHMGKPWAELAQEFAATVSELARRGLRGPFAAADGRVIHDAGGSEAQELAFALATAVAYLRAFESGGISIEHASRMIAFHLAADADQFLTIVKFRALRRLWRRVQESCGFVPVPASVHAETAWRSMTRDDPHVNILRSTIAVFSAGVGGADTIAVLPFTSARGLADRFARRVARNTQLVLLEETGVAHVADPTAGTGWSEALTAGLCQASWAQFQEIEAAGGAAAALAKGSIQAKVADARAAREQALKDKTEALIGATDYPMRVDAAALDVAPVALAELPAAVTCEPLVPVRLAAAFEQA